MGKGRTKIQNRGFQGRFTLKAKKVLKIETIYSSKKLPKLQLHYK